MIVNGKIGKIKLELLKEEFIKQIKDSYTLNLSMVLLEEFENLQQENARLKDKIEKIIEYVNHYETIRGYYEYEECGYDEYNYEENLKEELLEKLKEN